MASELRGLGSNPSQHELVQNAVNWEKSAKKLTKIFMRLFAYGVGFFVLSQMPKESLIYAAGGLIALAVLGQTAIVVKTITVNYQALKAQ